MNYGLQLYSVRDAAQKDYDAMLRCVAEMGYTQVEPAGFFDVKPREAAAMFRHYGLTVTGTHTPYAAMINHYDEMVDLHRIIGCNDIILPSLPKEMVHDMKLLEEGINSLQEKLEKDGMRLHFHNHFTEFRPNSEGLILEEELARRTDIGFEIDTFWAYDAGKDPVAVLEQYRDRIKFIHLKDGIPQDFSIPDNRAQGKSLGSGTAPVEAVRKKAIECGFGIVVESEGLDPTGPEEVRRCIEYLHMLDARDGI